MVFVLASTSACVCISKAYSRLYLCVSPILVRFELLEFLWKREELTVFSLFLAVLGTLFSTLRGGVRLLFKKKNFVFLFFSLSRSSQKVYLGNALS